MPSTSGSRLRMVVVIMLAIPLCIGWCVLALQQMLETLTSQVASFPMEREVIEDVQLAQRQADTQSWLGDVVLRKAGDAIGSIGTPDVQQTSSVNFVVAAVAADDFYTLQTVLTVVLIFSLIGVAILATAIHRLSSERIRVVTPAVGSEVGGEAAKFDAEPMDVRDLMTAMHTLGSEMRRQVSEVSHEMRTPLAIIAGSLASIQRTLPQDHQKGQPGGRAYWRVLRQAGRNSRSASGRYLEARRFVSRLPQLDRYRRLPAGLHRPRWHG